MKKIYTKPFIAVESFQLNAAIAASCSSQGKQKVGFTMDGCNLAEEAPNEIYIGKACAENILNSDINTDDGLCYQALEGFTDSYFTS